MRNIEDLREAKTEEEAREIIDHFFPDWIMYALDEYSLDYPHLQRNWEIICDKTGVTPQKIILVKEIIFDQEHVGTATVCEMMTRKGYCVRRVGEFFRCQICNRAIPCYEIWKLLKEKGFNVPEQWKDTCKNH